MAVDRCICREITFARAIERARGLGVRTVVALQPHLPIGTGCGRCIPYVQLALMSGRDDLPVLDDARIDELTELAGVRLLGEEE